MIKDGVKRRIWYGALVSLFFFIGIPVVAMLRFPSAANLEMKYSGEGFLWQLSQTKKEFQVFLGGGDYFLMLLVMAAALLGAWSSLAWLHSRKKTDFFCSLPVRREKILAAETVSTLLLYLIPYGVNLLLGITIAGVKGMLTGETILWAVAGLGIHLIFFLTLYFCAAVAMLLTGKLLTGILGTGVFLLIGPVIGLLFQAYPSEFWKTYVVNGGISQILELYGSPLTSFFLLTDRLDAWLWRDVKSNIWTPLLVGVGMLLFFGVIAFWLIKRRKAEAAEQSMAFAGTEGWIKAVILYPLVLGGGLFFRSLGSFQSMIGLEQEKTWYHLWLWFGVAFTLILGSILIEVIYHMDRKRILDHKGWTVGTAVAVIGTVVFFSFDLADYDHWIPEKEELCAAYAYEENVYWNFNDGTKTTHEYLKKNIQKNDPSVVLEMVQQGIAFMDEPEKDTLECWVTVLYQMKNGKIKERMYLVPVKDWKKARKGQINDPIYKVAQIPILEEKEIKPLNVQLNALNAEVPLNTLSEEEQKELVAIYQKELASLSYEEVFEEVRGTFTVDISLDHNNIDTSQTPINENFKQTLAYLKQKEIFPCFRLEDVEVEKIEIEDYRSKESTIDMEADVSSVGRIEIRDTEQIREALLGLQIYENWGIATTQNLEEDLQVTVTFRTDYTSATVTGAYERGKIPAIVENLLKEEEKNP